MDLQTTLAEVQTTLAEVFPSRAPVHGVPAEDVTQRRKALLQPRHDRPQVCLRALLSRPYSVLADRLSVSIFGNGGSLLIGWRSNHYATRRSSGAFVRRPTQCCEQTTLHCSHDAAAAHDWGMTKTENTRVT